MFDARQFIRDQRDGVRHAPGAVRDFVAAFTRGDVPEYQVTAWLMACFFRPPSEEETFELTDAMLHSGEVIRFDGLPAPTVDKHSTGGVGDKISLPLAPIVAACGACVPMISGRGLGHTGGTLDKLESIPGYRVDLTIDEFKAVLRDVGTSIIGQTASLAPADKKLYALRDVTSTVESVPLIASSVMSKKLAEGSNAVLLDVKCGDGAFMKTADQARALARAMVTIGRLGGIPTEAFVTEMDAPLGNAIGNTLEMVECFDTLKGTGPAELRSVVTRLAARMVILAGLEHDSQVAAARAEEAFTSGRALRTLSRMIELQGGNPRVIDDYRLMPSSPDRAIVAAARSGFVTRMAALAIGRAAHVLGAGRSKVGEPVDHGVGAVTLGHVGDQVREGQPLIELHHRGGRGLDEALTFSRSAIVIDDGPPAARAKILDEVR